MCVCVCVCVQSVSEYECACKYMLVNLCMVLHTIIKSYKFIHTKGCLLYMCVYVCVCVSVCVCVCVCVCVQSVSEYECACKYMLVNLCMVLHTIIKRHKFIHKKGCLLYMCVYMCVCV